MCDQFPYEGRDKWGHDERPGERGAGAEPARETFPVCPEHGRLYGVRHDLDGRPAVCAACAATKPVYRVRSAEAPNAGRNIPGASEDGRRLAWLAKAARLAARGAVYPIGKGRPLLPAVRKHEKAPADPLERLARAIWNVCYSMADPALGQRAILDHLRQYEADRVPPPSALVSENDLLRNILGRIVEADYGYSVAPDAAIASSCLSSLNEAMAEARGVLS